jgi:hypothetical protein
MARDAFGWLIWVIAVIVTLLIREGVAVLKDDDTKFTLSEWIRRLRDRFGVWGRAGVVSTIVGLALWLILHLGFDIL